MRKASIVKMSAKRSNQCPPGRRRLLVALLAFSSLTSGAALAAGGALPTGGHFVGGSGAITQGGKNLTVNQSTQLGIINWQSFSIGKGNTVDINNGHGATLNRVTGADMSTIAGSLKSTGSVYLVNQAGVVVGPSGRVATNGTFVASTRDVSNSTFMAGGNVDLSGSSSGTVVNQGTITSANGDVVLVGKSVSNSGTISAAKGSASLVAGDNVLLQASGDDAVLVESGSGDVTNTGSVQAAQIALNAAGGNVYALAVNNGGVIRATGTATKDGHVYLTAGEDVTVNGAVAATNADGSGGTVQVTAANVRIGGRARITANGTGKADGGTVLIGGDRHGGATPSQDLSKPGIANAQTTTVAAGAWIGANGGGRGNGGNVVVWSDTTTDFTGHISAQGGSYGGNGGQVEVSSEGVLGFTGRVSTKAARGSTGTLLLDPQDVTIYSSTDSNFPFTNTMSSSFILDTTIDTALASNNVTISTSGGTGAAGDIHFGTNSPTPFTNAAPIYWSSGFNLTLQADNSIDTPGGNPSSATGGANPINPGTLVNALGGGSITFNAAGSGLTTGGTAITITGDIAASGGTISLNSTGSGQQIVLGNFNTISNTLANGAGKIVLQADQVRLGSGSGPAGVITTPGEVDIIPTSPGGIILGDIDATGDFFNTDNTTLLITEDVFRIITNRLVIGSAQTTDISFQTANPTGENVLGTNVFDAANAKSLKLLTSTTGTVEQDANTPIIVYDPATPANGYVATLTNGAGGLAIQAGGAITLNNAANSFASLAVKQTGSGGTVSIAATSSTDGTLVIGAVADLNGITTVGAQTVTLNISGDTVTQSSGAANAIAPSSGSIKLELTGTSDFTLDNPANAVTTVGASVNSLTLYDNIDLITGTVGGTTGVTAATGDAAIVDNGNLTIGNGAGITSTAGNIKVEDKTFTNSDAGNAFSATGGTWRVYSQSPLNDSGNTAALSYSFVQYGATNSYSDPFTTADSKLGSHASGNGFLYTVSPTAAVTLTGTFNKTYDGTNAVTQTIGNSVYGTVTGTINGDTVSFTSLSDSGATYSTKNAGMNLAITLSQTVGVASAHDGNNVTVYGYGTNITTNLKGTISPKTVILSGTRQYDGTTGASGSILTVASGEISGDGTLTVTGAGTLASPNANTTATNISTLGTLALTGTNAGNYTIASGTVLVTPKDVTVTGTRVYDQTTGAAGSILTVNGEINGDPTLTVTGSGTLASANANTTATNISSLGTLALSGTGSGNYDIVSGTVLVTPKSVVVSGTRVYDQTTGASGSILTVTSGELSGDGTLTVTGSGTLASANASTTATNISSLGTLGLSGTNAGNYTIASGTVLVTPKGVTVTGTRAYDGTTGASGTILSVNGELNGDPALTVTGSGTLASPNANTTATNISSLGSLALSGTGSGNYDIISGTILVTPKIVTVTGTRIYNATTGASGSILSVNGEISGDPALTVTGSGTLASPNASTTATNISNLGTLALSGSGSSNYAIGSGTVLVTPKDVTVTGTRAYDGTTTAAGSILSVVGEINGDPVLTVTGSGMVADPNAGMSKNITNLGTLALSGTGSGNYHIVSGTLTITQALVTLADISGTRIYDGTTNANGSYLTVTDLIHAGDQVSVAGIGVLASKNVGKEQIVDLGTLHLTGADAHNYMLSASNPNDFVIVTKATLTVSAVTQTKVYDGTAVSSVTPTITGLQTGDSLTGGTIQSYNSRDVLGTNGSTLTATHNVVITDGNAGGNYNIVYKTAMGTITPEHVTVTATPNTKTYDGTDTATALPTVTSGMIFNPDTGHFTESYGTVHVGTGLTLTPTGTISDGNGGKNYIITFIPISSAHPGTGGKAGTITPAPLTISAVTQTKAYDGTVTSTETPIITAGELIGGDTLTNLSQAYMSKNVLGTNGSTLVINPDYVLTDASDYKVTLKTAMGTITPLAVDITGTRVYNATTDVDGSILTLSGLVSGDKITITGTGTSTSPHVGTHDITGGDFVIGGPDAGNYTLTGGKETVTITPFAVVLTGTRVYDGGTDGNSGILSVTNAFAGDTVTVASGTSTIVSRNVGDEKIVDFGTLTLGGASSGDYTLVGARGNVIVTPETITVTAVPSTKPYDGTDTSTGTPSVTDGTIYGPDKGNFIETYGSHHAGNNITLTPSGSVDDGNGGKNYIVIYKPITDGTIDPRAVVLYGTRPFDNGTDANSTILTITNLVPGDVVTVGGSTGTVISPAVGNETITNFTGLSLSGPSSGDYTLVGATGIVDITPSSPSGPTGPTNPSSQIDNQTSSGNGTQTNFSVPTSGIITLQPQQNGVVTGTIATIDGTDYNPDSQLGCTLGAAGCIQNGVAPTTTGAPQ